MARKHNTKISRKPAKAATVHPWPVTQLIVGISWLYWLVLKSLQVSLIDAQPSALIAGIGILVFLLMMGCVLAVVHYADQLAEILKEPYGTLVLTLTSTSIEVSLMLKVMLQGDHNSSLLRDTVFAGLMITMNLMVGLALSAGSWRHIEQSFNLRGASAFVQLIAPMSLFLLIMPNYTTSSTGPTLVPLQEAYLGVLCVVVYLLFLSIQTGRHKALFANSQSEQSHQANQLPCNNKLKPILMASFGLILSLLPMVLLSDYLGEAINYGVDELNLPLALGGLLIAFLGLIPEMIGACRAALANQIQRSINICLGSALSTIGLTVPCIMLLAAYLNMDLILGVAGSNSILLLATLLVTMLTFASGASSILQGIVHILLFIGYIIFILLP